MDLTAAYHLVEMSPTDQHKTAFTTPMGLFKFRRMSFGTWGMFKDEVMNTLLIYSDDILLFSRTIDEMLDRLEMVFRQIVAASTQVDPKNVCCLGKKSDSWATYLPPKG